MTSTRLRVAIRVLVILNLIIGCGIAVSAPAAPAEAATLPRCAWPLIFGVDNYNIAYPDTAAVYWSTQYLVTSDLEIKVNGVFPDARYASLNVYDSTTSSFTSEGVGSNLPDYQITPDAGSVNPWQTRGAAAGGAFTVTLRMSPDGEQNVLPLAPAGTADGTKGSLIFRVYLPKGNDFSKVTLPTLTATTGGVTTVLPMCATAARSPIASAAASALTTPVPVPTTSPVRVTSIPVPVDPNPIFTRIELNGAAPNADGQVVVIKGRAPTSVAGNTPGIWPDLRHDMRYYSMCVNLAEPNGPVVVNTLTDGSVDYGCRYDDNTTLSTGYYAYVLGTEAQRAQIEAIPGATFLPLSAGQPTAPHLLLLRNLLPVDSFTKSVQSVPIGSTPAEANAVMGAYYPQVTTQTLASLTE
jgi:hypothetical protein